MKYRGERSQNKIAGMIGSILRVINATKNEDNLTFAKVLVEMNINENFQEEVHFTNEYAKLIFQEIVYDWKPVHHALNATNLGITVRLVI